MKITTKSSYAIRAIHALVNLGGQHEPVSLAKVAETEGISHKYLEQIFRTLKSAGIVESSRGAGGGFVLARPAESITLKALVTAMDGPIKAVDCGDEAACTNPGSCTVNLVWSGLQKTVDTYFENITIRDLATDMSVLRDVVSGVSNGHLS